MTLGPLRFINGAGGTADFIYPGPAIDLHSPATAQAVNGTSYLIYAESLDRSQWEVSAGAYVSASKTFPRTAVGFNSLGTTAKINFTNPPLVSVYEISPSLAGFLVAANNLSDVANAKTARSNLGIPPLLRSYLAGLTLSTAGSSATFSVAAGVATDTTNAEIMALASAISKTTGAWAVGTGNGGLDTGSIANSTWYHVWLIERPDTGVVDVLISLSASTPTMPTNYTFKRRIGSVLTNGSAQWAKFSQNGDEFLWDVEVQDVNSVAISTTALTPTLTVPTGIQVGALFHLLYSNSAGAGASILTNSLDIAAAAVSLNRTLVNPQTGIGGAARVGPIRTNTSGQIRAVGSGASGTYFISTIGWIDRRGRDA